MKTHRWILIVFAFLGGAVPGIAQNQTVTPSDPVLSREYVSPDHRFKIRFPDVPQELEFPLDTKTGQLVLRMVMHTSTITYSLSYTDFPVNFDKADVIKATLDKGRDGSLARVAKEDPRILTETDISVDGYPGRFLRVELKGDAIIRYKIVLAGNRQYALAVGTPKGDPKDADAQKNYDKFASSFFDSFKIIAALEADLTATWKEFSSTEGKYRIQFPGTPFRLSLPLEALRPPSTLYMTIYNSSGQYSVMYMDYAQAPTPTDRPALKSFLDGIRDGQIEQHEQIGGKLTVVSETDITFDGYPGRFMVANLNDVAINRVKTIVVKNRVYFITVLVTKDDPKASDPKVYEKLAMKFINSFVLMSTAAHHPRSTRSCTALSWKTRYPRTRTLLDTGTWLLSRIFLSFESTPVLLKTKTSEVGRYLGWSVPAHCFKGVVDYAVWGNFNQQPLNKLSRSWSLNCFERRKRK